MEKIDDLLIDSHCSIRDALIVIDRNNHGLCFVVKDEVLVGIATDGDIRRSLLNGKTLDCLITDVMNQDFVSYHVDDDESVIRHAFSPRIRIIPLYDDTGKVVDYADLVKIHRIPVLEPELSGNEIEYIQDCIDSNWISSQGRYVRRFEQVFEEMYPGMHALAVSNGTVALHLALIAYGISDGDEVIVPDLTFAATVNAVMYCNAVPVLCEVDSDSWCISIDEAEKLITPRTKAIMPVHLYGQVADADAIQKLANKYNLIVIDDCAEALGSKWNGVPVGSGSSASTFSFFGNKMISTGEGGMVVFRDSDVAKRARVLRDHGMSPNRRYWHETVGYNYRITNIQAAIGVAQMERFSYFLSKKQDIASRYRACLDGVDAIEQEPAMNDLVFHSQWLYTVILSNRVDRDRVISSLKKYGIDSRPVFFPIHQMPPYVYLRRSDCLSNSIKIATSGISLPSSVKLSMEDIEYVSEMFKKVLSEMVDNRA